MKIISIIVLVAFMALTAPTVGNARDDAAGSVSSKGVISRIIDSIGTAIGNVVNKVAEVFKIKDDKEKRDVDGNNSVAKAGEARQKEVLEFKVEAAQAVESSVGIQPVPEDVGRGTLDVGRGVLQAVPSGQAGVNLLPAPVMRPAPIQPIEPAVPAMQPAVIMAQPAPVRNDPLGLAKVNVDPPKVESATEPKSMSALIVPAPAPAPAPAESAQPASERKEAASAETQVVPVIVSGYAPLPRTKDEGRGTKDEGRNVRETVQVARGQTQPPIVQSGEVLGTGATTRSPLELMNADPKTETRVGTVDNARTATTDCVDVVENIPEGIKRISTPTVSGKYILVERNDGNKQVISTCGSSSLECSAGTLIERNSQNCGPSGERSAMTDAVRDEMLGVCRRASELLPPPVGRTVAVAEDISKARFINTFDNKLLYVLNDTVRITKQEDPAKPVTLDIMALNAADGANLTFTAICKNRASLSDCTASFEISSTALDKNNVDVTGLISATDGGRSSSVTGIDCNADTSPLTVTVIGRRGGEETQKTITLGKRLPQVEEEASEAVTADTVAADAAGGGAVDNTLYVDTTKIPDGAVNEASGESNTTPPMSPEGMGIQGGACSLVTTTGMRDVSAWSWLIFTILVGFSCVVFRLLIKVPHEQTHRDLNRRR